MTLRENVLEALKENHNEWISGEALSEKLNVSRTTIWKYIKTLQAEGYEVDSSPKKGYRLGNPPNLLSPDEVCPGLTTKIFGREHYFYYREIDSTNNCARILASQGYPAGTVIAAEMQTAGRGRRGRSWYSPAGKGIYFSVILRPNLPLKFISRVSLATAVAIAETLHEELDLPAFIKWPNDILINHKKIAGILSEAVTDMDGVEYIVTGIGMNVNNQAQDFPDEFRANATSILAECNHPVSRVKILHGLLSRLENHFEHLPGNSFARTLEKGKNLSIVIGQQVRLDTINDSIIGHAIDIDNNGFLLVRDQTGKINTIMSGEISILPSSQSDDGLL